MKELASRCVQLTGNVTFGFGRRGLANKVPAAKLIFKYGPCLFEKRITAGR
jgi:hypothetical protein